MFFALFFCVLRLSNFVPLASGALSASRWCSRGRRLSLGLSPLALASLACHPACTEERSDRSGGISPCRRLSLGLCFFRPSVTRLSSRAQSRDLHFAFNLKFPIFNAPFVPLASGALSASRWSSRGRRLSLGLSPLALASLACHPACTEERSDRSGGISPCRRLSLGLCFFRPSVTRLSSRAQSRDLLSPYNLKISNFQCAVCTAGLRRAVRVPMVFAGPVPFSWPLFLSLYRHSLSSRAQSRDLLSPYNLKFPI